MSDDPSPKDIELLATLATNIPNSAGSDEVKRIAWERLTAIPDFPDRLLRRIQEAREEWQAGKDSAGGYDASRAHTIRIMARVRHPGMVEVLGQLLADWEWPGWEGDPRKRDAREGAEDSPRDMPNCILAARALGEIIYNPPVQKKTEDFRWDEVEIWQLWYAQVKSGNRSFRIKGDPTEYKLQGSSVVAASSTGTELPKAPAPKAVAAEEDSRGKDMTLAAVISACGILGLALFAFLRSRHGRARDQ